MAATLPPAFAQVQPDATTGIGSGSLNFQKSPPNNLVDLYEQLSGKHVIRDANLDGFPPVSMNATGLSKPKTIDMIKATLLLNNISIVKLDENTEKVITIGTTKNPKSEGVPVYANAVDLPAADQLVSYYMPLDYISQAEAATIFQSVAPFHQYGSYTPAPSAQAVILTENTSVIRQLITLKELIDAPPAHVVSEWIPLNGADSDKVADLLNKLLSGAPPGAPGAGAAAAAAAAGGGGVQVPANLGNNAPLSNEHNLISGPAQIVSDPRTNRILIVTRPVNLSFLEQMVAQLDSANTSLIPQRRELRYVLAQDILPALEAALAQGKDEETQVQKDQTTAQNQANRPGGQNGAASTQAQPVAAAGASGGTGSVSAITPQLATPNQNNVPTVVIIGKTRLMADNRSNSIIVFGSKDIVKRTFAMIDELDRKPLQVYLGTVIGQLEVKEGLEFGIDIFQNFVKVGQGGLANGLVTPGTTSSSQVPIPSTLTSSLGFPLPTGLTLYGAIGSTLSAYVRALESTNRFKIISRPSVFTTNNKLAVIASGSQIPVPQSQVSGFTGSTTDNGLTTQTSIAYQQVLLQLDIIPLINAAHEVTLQIRQTNNTQGNNITIGGNDVPIINTQEINTEITVPNKSTVVIGGLITDNTTRNTSGVPWLSDIPVLGYLFKDTKKDKQRDELIIMIQPSVVETEADQIAVNEEEKQRTILGREAVEAATGQPAPLPQPALIMTPPTTTTTTTTHGTVYNSKTGTPSRTTTTTTTTAIPTQVMTPLGPTSPTGPIPALSSPAPDVGNGALPRVNPPSPTPTAP